MGLLPKPPVADEGALPVGTPMASTSIAQFLALNPRLSTIKAKRDTKGWEKRTASVDTWPCSLAIAWLWGWDRLTEWLELGLVRLGFCHRLPRAHRVWFEGQGSG